MLDAEELRLTLPNGEELLRGVSLHVEPGETVGLVGESGSGKSLTARAALGLWPENSVLTGSLRVDGHEVVGADDATIESIRRTSAAMIFQDPRAGINPLRTIGDHMTETLRFIEHRNRSDADDRARQLLGDVALPDPASHLEQYPHEFSGGMLQRVMIAGALTSDPPLLICDEPTTALDVTTQAAIIKVLKAQQAEREMAMLFITHDLNLAASICQRVYVMRHGEIVESGPAHRIFSGPENDYTKQLLAATPTVDVTGMGEAQTEAALTTFAAPPTSATPALAVSDVSRTYYRRGKPPVHAVKHASFEIPNGGALGIVGESGSGKSTLARMVVSLEQADAGSILIDGEAHHGVPRGRRERLARAKAVQMVFQDPYLSLDPRIAVGQAITDVLALHSALSKSERQSRMLELLHAVGLDEAHALVSPRKLSGGQRQRVAIARALAIEPRVLVMDEATSALDVSVQAQILGLVAELREQQGLTVMFISHDIGVVRRVCDETIVMKAGEIVERGATEGLLRNPAHPYTRLLIDSIPRPS